ncbi:MAG: DNA polymerase III subunit alpha [Oscillospiraceae bacterium]|nr:DNA polymerase III subunit alpha [Oscillospiraceae bacterium]
MSFCHLHTHTEYSLLDGEASIKKLVARVKELGMTSCAITDHGSMYGVVDFYREAKAQGIHPVIGCEVYMAPRTRFDKVHDIDNKTSHLILLAENQIGYQNLIKLVSSGYTEGFYYKPRIDFDLLKEHSEGIIALSACLAGEVPKAILSGHYNTAKEIVEKYVSVLGKDNYFLEIQDHGISDQRRIIPEIIRLSQETGIGLVATNDIHYLKKEDAKYQDVLMCIQMEKTVDDPDRMKFETEEFYIKSPEEMADLFEYIPEAIENTGKIAQRCQVDFDFETRHLPSFAVPDGKDAFSYLKELCEEGLGKRYNPVRPEIKEQLDYELGVIKNMGFVDYFLIVWDFIHFAKNNGVMVGPGRGSAAGSIVSYSLGITTVDPIKYGLFFERFLNPERVSMPDIDIDFAPEGRQKVIDYVVEKYGEGQVAQIITFGTMKAKLAIRDVGRALNIPYAEVDKVAKLVPFDLKMTIQKALDISNELRALYDNDPKIKELLDTSMALEGLPRHSSTHAAGVVITSEPIVNYVPLQLNTENFITTQFTKDTVESLGLLKMDFLGLRNLTVIENAVKIIKKTKGIDLDIDSIDYDCREVYELISSGNTDGVFQLESAGMQSFMQEMRPASFEDIIAGISLYRPGPMEQIPRYIHNKNNPEKVTYKHPLLEGILNTTYGCMVYQEQVLEIVRTLAGYSLGKADLMRRTISKKKADQMEIERKNFIYGSDDGEIPGCIKNGISEATAIAIFDEISDFANYGFNKSHAAAYAVVAYQTAYLKTFYPVEYMASLISSVDDLDKINHYIANCKEMGINRLPPDVNRSEDTFTVENGSIRFGLSAVKNVGRAMIINLVNERNNNGEFKSFSDFIDRMTGRDMNKRALEGLISCGAFDSMGIKRSQLLAVYERAIDGAAREARDNVAGQLSLFDSMDEHTEMEFPDIQELDKKVLLKMEKQSTGMYFSGHPMEEYTDKIKKLTKYNISDVLTSVHRDDDGNYHAVEGGIKDGDMIVICAAIASRKNKTTRANAQMAFLNLEDVYGSVECLVFPKVLSEYSFLLQEDNMVAVSCRLSIREDEEPKLLMQSVLPLDEALINKKEPKRLYIQLETRNEENLKKIEEALAPYHGDMEVRLFFTDTRKMAGVPRRLWFNGTEGAINDIKSIFGEDNVKVK